MARVYLSIGSNIDREANVRSALRALQLRFGPLVTSPVYESRAVGFESDDFYNLVVGLDTELPAEQLPPILRQIEDQHGRERGGALRPRTLDIDLLLYDDQVCRSDGLILPRPEIERYAFVLLPLAQLAPELRHPLAHVTMAELWEFFPDKALQPIRAVTL